MYSISHKADLLFYEQIKGIPKENQYLIDALNNNFNKLPNEDIDNLIKTY